MIAVCRRIRKVLTVPLGTTWETRKKSAQIANSELNFPNREIVLWRNSHSLLPKPFCGAPNN